MAEVTYFVALPFVAADDGIAAGEPTECFNPNAAVMRAEARYRAKKATSAQVLPLQRSGIGAASAELLLARMEASVDALCIKRDTFDARTAHRATLHEQRRFDSLK